jgi:hypothetical protein
MPPEESRYDRGLASLRAIFGAGIESALQGLAATSPDLERCLVEFPFGDIYPRPGLDLKLMAEGAWEAPTPSWAGSIQQRVDCRNNKAEQCSGVPKGQPYQSPGRRQGELCEPWRSPGWCTWSTRSPNGTALIPRVLFVQFQSMTPAEFTELFLKRHSLMMLLLILDVLLHSPRLGPPRCGYRKCDPCTQGGDNARCARIVLPWASIGPSLRD